MTHLPNGYLNVWTVRGERDGSVSVRVSFFREIDDAIEEVADGGPVHGSVEYRHTIEILGGTLDEIDLRNEIDAWLENMEIQARHERGLRNWGR